MNFDVGEQTTTSQTGEPLEISWRNPHGMVGLSFFNTMMRVLTLGIYDFWGRTDVRKRIWSSVRLNGEPLIYTGTGGELFFGFLIIFGVLILPMILIALGIWIYLDKTYFLVFYGLSSILFFFLYGVAIYRAQRYRLSRTRWRGIRGGLVGNSLNYGWAFFWSAILIPFTMGWIMPWRTTMLQRIITNDTNFGNRPFSFKGQAGPLYPQFTVLWCGSLILYFFAIGVMIAAGVYSGLGEEVDPANQEEFEEKIGTAMSLAFFGALVIAAPIYYLLSAWYRAKVFNYFASATHFENARFRGTATGMGFFMLGLTNALIAVCSLFILMPLVHARTARYIIEHVRLDGTVPVEEIVQGTQDDPSTGEGLAHALEIDAF